MKQLLLRPSDAFPAPAPARSAPPRPRAPRPAAKLRPTRWLPGTAPTIHLPMAGTGRARRYRQGHKPGSIGNGKLTRAEREEMELLTWELAAEGVRFGPPATLGDCEPGPCGHVGCSMNLFLDVHPVTGIIKLNFPGLDIDQVPETCALRVANTVEAEGKTMPMEEVGRLINLTMGRVDQLEKRAVRKCADVAADEGWGEDWRHVLART